VKILLSWLREFVEVRDSASEIARTMSLRGFAVEGVEPAGADDAVLDFEVTANRPDCMSVAGMALEVATAYGLPLRHSGSPADDSSAASEGTVEIAIETPELCPRYVGALADVSIGPSPDWMRQRLQACGVRPISNVVDVTNYVLLELGQPMHAFDLTRLDGGCIRVRTARPGETIRTIDGQLRPLDGDMLVIADAQRPVAVAGVMGGAASEVGDATTATLLESACFNPLSVRRTSKRLGLKTEASMRFERGTDPALPLRAMERAVTLLEQIGAGRRRGASVDNHPLPAEPKRLRLRRGRISEVLGAAVPDDEIVRILRGLGFTLEPAADGWTVTTPTRRVDILREIDLIEEVARHHGFDRIPVTFPALTFAPPPIDPRITQARRLRNVMTGAGFFEAVTFGFIGEAAAAPFAAAGDLVPIANPLSENFAVLRPSLVPGLVAAVAHNRRREQHDVRLFEVGASFTRSDGERRSVAWAWTGAAAVEHWSHTGRTVDFFDIKAVAERMTQAMGADVRAEACEEGWLVRGRRAALLAGDTRAGTLGQLDPAIAEAHGVPEGDAVFVAELDLDALERIAGARETRVAALPKYPSVVRDISVLVDETLKAGDVRQTVIDAGPSTLVGVTEFDRYQGKGIPERKLSLSLRLTFRSPDRTLTDDEVHDAMRRILERLVDRHGAVQR
jgi:phenylalanyl-tRNA synthetase beta chain